MTFGLRVGIIAVVEHFREEMFYAAQAEAPQKCRFLDRNINPQSAMQGHSNLMPELRFTDSVAVYESDNDRASQLVKASKAAHLLLRGDASIHSWTKDGRIVALRAVYRKKHLGDLESVRPGAPGIQKLTADGRDASATQYGARVFQHHDPLPVAERAA